MPAFEREFPPEAFTPVSPPGPPPGTIAPERPRPPDAPLTGPLLAWLGVQFFGFLLALLRVPLAADYPKTGEMLGAHVVVITQTVASAFLFPFLLRSFPAAVVVIVTAWPFVVLGGVMSAVPPANVIATGSYVTAWLVALFAWRAACPARLHFGSVAAAIVVTAGSVLLFYLRLDLSSGTTPDAAELARQWAWASPPLAALHGLNGSSRAQDWCTPALVAAAAALCGILIRRRRQVIHNV